MKERILEFLKTQFEIYGNASGTNFFKISQAVDISRDEIMTLLDELRNEKKIRKQEGLNEPLYFLNK
ncbi:hypothetical protein PQ459_10020 [Chryseobacterium sp. KACC 21268]|nr:hypothetical protein PQ459_10020 [Chryseobacterium sp. KACC 21268]